MKRLLTTSFVLALVVMALVSCAPRRNDPPVFWNNTKVQAELAAKVHAGDIGGRVYLVMPTGSMEPFITGGDWLTIDTSFSFDKLVVGDICTYNAPWNPLPVTHRIAAKHGNGFIMSGDANAHYERGNWIMTKDRYIGKCVAVYTQRTK